MGFALLPRADILETERKDKPSTWLPYVRVNDVQKAVAVITRAGGRIIVEPSPEIRGARSRYSSIRSVRWLPWWNGRMTAKGRASHETSSRKQDALLVVVAFDRAVHQRMRF